MENTAKADDNYIEALQKACAQLKMENAALVNLIGAVVFTGYIDEEDNSPKRTVYVANGALTAHYTVTTHPAENHGMNITATQDAE